MIFPAGKLNRGLSVIDSYRLLKEGKELTEDEIFLASVLGWCIEWVRYNYTIHSIGLLGGLINKMIFLSS